MNDKFYRLCQPIKLSGRWDSKYRDKWVVCTWYSMGGEPYGYLHNDNTLYEYWLVPDSLTSGLFETRLDALIETQAYYQHRSEDFPYGKELNDEFKCFTASCSGTQTIESQTMVFK